MTSDFERAWLTKFSACLERVAGEGVREQVLMGSTGLTSETDRHELIAWTRGVMERMLALVAEEDAQQVMLGCACRYPKAELAEIREAYIVSGDLTIAHRMLQERFETFLQTSLQLDESMVEEVVRRGWGLAGRMHGRTVIATKIPKSQYLAEYLMEPDPVKRRRLYCHCPRIRDVLRSPEMLPAVYCYCGAGYYKSIWEEIVQGPVEVELLESVLAGDEVCRVAVYLP